MDVPIANQVPSPPFRLSFWSRAWRTFVTLVICALGLGYMTASTYASWVFVRSGEIEVFTGHADRVFEHATSTTQSARVLASALQVVANAGEHELDEGRMRHLRAAATQMVRDHGFVAGVTYHPRIVHHNRRQFERQHAQLGLEFGIVDDLEVEGRRATPLSSPARDEYFPLLWSDGFAADAVVPGLDIAADSQRRVAASAAMRTGQPTLGLVRPTPEGRLVTELLVATYAESWFEAAMADRTRQATGMLVVLLDTHALFGPEIFESEPVSDGRRPEAALEARTELLAAIEDGRFDEASILRRVARWPGIEGYAAWTSNLPATPNIDRDADRRVVVTHHRRGSSDGAELRRGRVVLDLETRHGEGWHELGFVTATRRLELGGKQLDIELLHRIYLDRVPWMLMAWAIVQALGLTLIALVASRVLMERRYELRRLSSELRRYTEAASSPEPSADSSTVQDVPDTQASTTSPDSSA